MSSEDSVIIAFKAMPSDLRTEAMKGRSSGPLEPRYCCIDAAMLRKDECGKCGEKIRVRSPDREA